MKIQKDGITLSVSQGAFKEMFEPIGWQKTDDANLGNKNEPVRTFNSEGEITLKKLQKDTQDNFESKNEDDTDLSEIPLGEMSIPQLKQYAEQLGLNAAGIASAKAIRKMIREALA